MSRKHVSRDVVADAAKQPVKRPKSVAERHELYREFLRKHPSLFTEQDRQIVRAMQRAGLIAPSTYWKDVKIRPLVDEVLREPLQ